MAQAYRYQASQVDEAAIYIRYKQRGGAHPRRVFGLHLQAFYDLTFDAYIGGLGDRRQALGAFERFIGSQVEARRYFHAVDSFSPYT